MNLSLKLSCHVLITTILLILALPQHSRGATPLIVAHRGLLKVAPENTLANFRACLELRLGFEFDVQRTKDGHLVCMHDSTVNRTTDGSGKVSNLSLAEIRKLDAGSWFDSQFAGERVPTIDEVLELVSRYRQHEILIAVDFKDADVEQDVVRLAEKHQVLPRLIFIGRTIKEPQVRVNLKAASVKAETAAVANDATEFAAALDAPNADWVYLRYLAPASEIKRVHTAHKRTFIAGPTVSGDLPDNWRQITNAGVDAILTDYPLELRLALKSNARN